MSGKTIASYLVSTTYEDLPDAAVDKAKMIILDTLGCALAGYKTEAGRILISVMKGLGGNPQSTIIGDGSKISCVHAGFANSVLSDYLDFEDTLRPGHPSATVIPAALAVGEYVGSSGKDLITAIVLGYEVLVRVGLAVFPSRERSEKVASNYASHVWGATAASGKLLGLNEEEMLDAFGCAGSLTPLPLWIAKWPKPLHWLKNNYGGQTAAGILGGLLAKEGFLGPRTILDSDEPNLGFWVMVGSDRCDFDKMVSGLGKEHVITKTNFKPYPACRWTHTTLDAVGGLLKDHQIKPWQIEEILVRVPSRIAKERSFSDDKPMTIVDAEFSLPYVVAMIVLGETPSLDWYAKEKMRDSRVLDIGSRVKVAVDPEADKVYLEENKAMSTVKITTKDGKEYTKCVDLPKGDYQKPLTKQELLNKFMILASSTLKKEKIERIIQTLDRLEHLTNISKLTALLV